MPVRGDLHHVRRPELAHRGHPRLGGLGDVGFDPGFGTVGRKVGLEVVVHEGVVVDYALFLEERDELFGGGPVGGGVAFGFLAVAEVGEGGY